MGEWWQTFFDEDYLKIVGQWTTAEEDSRQAAELWALLQLAPGCRILDAPCGWGRLSRPLALLGAEVVGVDQSAILLNAAEARRGAVPASRLRYVRHDLRHLFSESAFDVACNIFTSFGYGSVEDDLAMFATLRQAVRPGGRVVIETNHRDALCAYLTRGGSGAKRLPDGTLFLDQPDFNAISGIVGLNWYWSGPGGSGEKHAQWRCYSPTQIVEMLGRAGLRFTGAYQGLSRIPYGAQPARLAIVAVRDT